MKFRECDTINSKENIQAGYRNGSRIVNWWCINKTSTLNYGADTNLSFIIAYDIPRLHLSEFNRQYPGRLQKRTLENGSCTQQIFTLTMCLPACLWAQIARTLFNYTITARTLLPKYNDYQFQKLIFQFPALGKKLSYRSHVHHNPSRKYASRCWDKRKWLHVLWDKPFPEVRTNRIESMKT